MGYASRARKTSTNTTTQDTQFSSEHFLTYDATNDAWLRNGRDVLMFGDFSYDAQQGSADWDWSSKETRYGHAVLHYYADNYLTFLTHLLPDLRDHTVAVHLRKTGCIGGVGRFCVVERLVPMNGTLTNCPTLEVAFIKTWKNATERDAFHRRALKGVKVS